MMKLTPAPSSDQVTGRTRVSECKPRLSGVRTG